MKDLVRGFSRGGGFREEEILRVATMPDVLNFLVGWGALITGAPTLGCTSVAAWGDYTVDGKFLYARNLDFVGNGYWDKNPLVTRHKPDIGIPFTTIGSAGVMVDGITGINAEGLTVAIHEHYSTEVGFFAGGRPILDLALRVLQNARTVDEAVRLCASWPTISGWSLVVTQWKQRRACVIERTRRNMKVRYAHGERLVQTNDYADPLLNASELNHPGFRESSRLRPQRANEILRENKGAVDASLLAGLLNDRLDPDRARIRAFAQAIHQPNNLTCVIMEPENGILWVSAGEAPACEGPFLKVPMWEEKGPGETLSIPADPLSPRRREAYTHYLMALKAWFDRRDSRAALLELEEAVTGDPEDPIYRQLYGQMALKVGETETALESFEIGAHLPDMRHRTHVQRLWQARSLDLLGRRPQATTIYESLTRQNPVPPLHRAARKGMASAYQAAAIKDVMPDFFYGDVYAY